MGIKEKQEKEAQDFERILRRFFPEKEKYQGIKILNICCGTINEEPVLYNYFNPSKLVSIDNCESMEKQAKEFGRKSFVRADLTSLENVLDDKFDLLLGRNVPLDPAGYGTYPGSPLCYVPKFFLPKLGHYKPVTEDDEWFKIFLGLKKFAEGNAGLFLTLLRDDEYLRAQDILKKAGYIIVQKEQNICPCTSDNIGVAADYKDSYLIYGKV